MCGSQEKQEKWNPSHTLLSSSANGQGNPKKLQKSQTLNRRKGHELYLHFLLEGGTGLKIKGNKTPKSMKQKVSAPNISGHQMEF